MTRKNTKCTHIILKYRYLLFFAFLIGCKGERVGNDDNIADLVYKKEILREYKPGQFVNDSFDLYCHGNNYFIVDARYGTLFIYNINFKLIKEIGKRGKGPGEYAAISGVYVTDENIFIADYALNCIDKYSREKFAFIERIRFPSELRVPLWNFYANDDNCFILNKFSAERCEVVMYDHNKKENISIHEFKTNPSKELTAYLNYKDKYVLGIMSHSNKIMVFSVGSNSMIKELEVTVPHRAFSTWESWMRDGKNPPLFIDGYIENGFLYLAYQDFANNRNSLIRLSFDNDFNIKATEHFFFKEKNGDQAFCVNNDKVISFSSVSGSIIEYKIPNK